MSSAKVSATDGSEGFAPGPSRRSVLSILPATLFARWLGMGGRPAAGSATPEAPTHGTCGLPRHATTVYNHAWGVESAGTYSFENAGATLVVRDGQGRLVATQSHSAGSVRNYRYDGC